MENWIPNPTCDPPPQARPPGQTWHPSGYFLITIIPNLTITLHSSPAGNLTHHLTGHNPEAMGKESPLPRGKRHIWTRRENRLKTDLEGGAGFTLDLCYPPVPPPPYLPWGNRCGNQSAGLSAAATSIQAQAGCRVSPG